MAFRSTRLSGLRAAKAVLSFLRPFLLHGREGDEQRRGHEPARKGGQTGGRKTGTDGERRAEGGWGLGD
jgi:hypothetical protein